jgi:hypothetical protein
MRATTGVFLSFSVLALAYQVTVPNTSQDWTITGPNNLTWVGRNATDPLNFTAVLTNQDPSVMPIDNQVLAALVDGDLGTIVANPPSGGWPVGDGFRVNLVPDTDSLTTILAQSSVFKILNPSNSSTTSSATVAATAASPDASASYVDPLASPTPTAVASGAEAAPALVMQIGFASTVGLLAILFA